ncbi:MAG TPA: hypothetical protein VFR15_10465 [Chloroflexia bacterium]|nr:hypothetical protein [Chloroflexia bacterium]
MLSSMTTFAEPQLEYEQARRRARTAALTAALTRGSRRLWSLGDFERDFPIEGSGYRGATQVPVRNIVGSVNRYRDFDRDFNPLRAEDRDRWARVAEAYLEGATLPPVDLIKIGDVYVVRDGNHRVSVARHFGVEYIDAVVTEYVTPGDTSICVRTLLGERLQSAGRRLKGASRLGA